ncbi:MAG: VanZ family protein [bacterium]|nr:VanZ family protein [bacterium]
MNLRKEIHLSPKAKFLWGMVIALTVTIYSTLSIMRDVLRYVYHHIGRNRFGAGVDVFLITVMAAIVVYFLLRKKIHRNLFDLFTLVVVFLATGITMQVMEIPEERAHFLEYGLLGGLIFSAWSKNLSGNWLYLGSIFLVSLLGGIDEIIQYYLPNRVGEIRDWILNVAGGMIGISVAWILNRPSRSNSTKQTENENPPSSPF